MKDALSSRERLKIAIANGKPDRVPCIPDFSNMIPAKMTGKPFWDIYLHNNPSLYRAYCNAVKYYGIDGWHCVWDGPVYKRKNGVELTRNVVSRGEDRIVERFTYNTPHGELWEETTYLPADPPTKTRKLVKDLKEDFPKIRHFYNEIVDCDASMIPEYRALCGDDGVFTLMVGYPGMHSWVDCFDGNLQAAIYAYNDYPEIFDEWAELIHNDVIKQTEIILGLKPDLLLVGGSGTLTLASPDLVRKFALPTIKKVCHMAKEAGVLTMLHSCGKSMAFLDMLVNETELNCVNPLEVPPMGDVSLAEVKKLYGSRIALMGNLQTTTVMLKGTVDEVERAAKQAIDDAGANGGFLLSTGDQCGRDTPEENIFKLVEVAKTYGRYQ
jgi:uroporphyrinogen decarboxylase